MRGESGKLRERLWVLMWVTVGPLREQARSPTRCNAVKCGLLANGGTRLNVLPRLIPQANGLVNKIDTILTPTPTQVETIV